jgi:hypothetical protein
LIEVSASPFASAIVTLFKAALDARYAGTTMPE